MVQRGVNVDASNGIHGARAQCLHHRIRIDARLCNRPWLLHELAHVLLPERRHDGSWCGVMVELWEREFSVDRARAIALAAEHGVVVSEAKAAAGGM
jgi:hypothetical protein